MLATIDALGSAHPELAVLMVTHHLEELMPRTDEVLLLSAGRAVAQGVPKHVLTDQHVSNAFGCPVTVERHNSRWRWSVKPEVWAELL